MWTTTATCDTRATPAAVWAIWSDVDAWTSFDESLDGATLDGPFATGTTGTISPTGMGTLPFTVTAVTDGESYSDEAAMGPVSVRFHHRVDARDEGARITVTVEVDGPDDERVGPMVAEDLPRSLRALAQEAERRG